MGAGSKGLIFFKDEPFSRLNLKLYRIFSKRKMLANRYANIFYVEFIDVGRNFGHRFFQDIVSYRAHRYFEQGGNFNIEVENKKYHNIHKKNTFSYQYVQDILIGGSVKYINEE